MHKRMFDVVVVDFCFRFDVAPRPTYVLIAFPATSHSPLKLYGLLSSFPYMCFAHIFQPKKQIASPVFYTSLDDGFVPFTYTSTYTYFCLLCSSACVDVLK